MTSVSDRSAAQEPIASPTPLHLGLLGLGTVGGAVARLSRADARLFQSRDIAPVVTAALVRDAARPRPASELTALLTSDIERFFAAPIDVVVEALGRAEPARTLVARALDAGIPVVTANKTLIAAHGDELLDLARRRGTILRYEATCIAGVPFLGTFERRPFARRVRAVTGILNGTSNAILSALAAGSTFPDALADAQRRGLAEPDPSADITGADAAQKLTILVRLFGGLRVSPAVIPSTPLDAVDVLDVGAARVFDGYVKPLACASWNGSGVRAFVSPAFVDGHHPLARVSNVINGVVLDAHGGPQCFIGPGAGPDVTASTLLDDVIEVAAQRSAVASITGTTLAATVSHPETRWFVRMPGGARQPDVADLLGSFGIWCERLSAVGDRTYALTFAATRDRMAAATAALASVTSGGIAAIPALTGEASC
ncbi:MAG TPA: homoserine dehydrogenase [Vicinamibacterales bacterium]|jgi:homoserine dehydrogenase|nr:homoserine dehydrogenase [Vicinamibacterales bacterium]